MTNEGLIWLDLVSRESHRYRDGWRYEDDWRHIGRFSVLRCWSVREADGFDDGGEDRLLVAVESDDPSTPRSERKKLETKALYDSLAGTNCQHEYDCCGCLLVHVDVAWSGRMTLPGDIRANLYLVEREKSFNY